MNKLMMYACAAGFLTAGAVAQSGIQNGDARPAMPSVTTSQPVAGVWLRTEAGSSVKAGTSGTSSTEIRVEHGRANVQVAHPADGAEILVDLPGGQVSLVKDGLYTFNAETDTVRVLRGEADAYTGGDAATKPVKVKEYHQFAFNGKPTDADPRQAMADVLPMGPGMGGGRGGNGDGYRGGYGNGYAPGYGYGPYGDGLEYPYALYPYAGYGFGYPYGFGYGYPYLGFGLGFGYYGGFHGGYRGFRR